MADEIRENPSENPAQHRPWIWTEARDRAALLLAEDELPDAQIADAVGVNPDTLYEWKKRREFTDKIAEYVKKIGAPALRYAIAKLSRRVAALDAEWRRLNKVIEDRAADPDLATVPGGTTGLVIRRRRVLGSGGKRHVVDEFEVDVATLREIRETLKQAAIECGQWQKRMALAADPEPVKVYIGIDPVAALRGEAQPDPKRITYDVDR